LKLMRWLSLDVGVARVGVALSDPSGEVVTTLSPLAFKGPQPLALQVAELVDAWSVEGVVVGVPSTRSGKSRGEVRVAQVVATLREHVGVPVEVEDERGTSRAADTLLREAGVPLHRRAALRDGIAARLILETFLARLRNCCTSPADVDRGCDG
jgi:putative Holliday junction resolvase